MGSLTGPDLDLFSFLYCCFCSIQRTSLAISYHTRICLSWGLPHCGLGGILLYFIPFLPGSPVRRSTDRIAGSISCREDIQTIMHTHILIVITNLTTSIYARSCFRNDAFMHCGVTNTWSITDGRPTTLPGGIMHLGFNGQSRSEDNLAIEHTIVDTRMRPIMLGNAALSGEQGKTPTLRDPNIIKILPL